MSQFPSPLGRARGPAAVSPIVRRPVSDTTSTPSHAATHTPSFQHYLGRTPERDGTAATGVTHSLRKQKERSEYTPPAVLTKEGLEYVQRIERERRASGGRDASGGGAQSESGPARSAPLQSLLSDMVLPGGVRHSAYYSPPVAPTNLRDRFGLFDYGPSQSRADARRQVASAGAAAASPSKRSPTTVKPFHADSPIRRAAAQKIARSRSRPNLAPLSPSARLRSRASSAGGVDDHTAALDREYSSLEQAIIDMTASSIVESQERALPAPHPTLDRTPRRRRRRVETEQSPNDQDHPEETSKAAEAPEEKVQDEDHEQITTDTADNETQQTEITHPVELVAPSLSAVDLDRALIDHGSDDGGDSDVDSLADLSREVRARAYHAHLLAHLTDPFEDDKRVRRDLRAAPQQVNVQAKAPEQSPGHSRIGSGSRAASSPAAPPHTRSAADVIIWRDSVRLREATDVPPAIAADLLSAPTAADHARAVRRLAAARQLQRDIAAREAREALFLSQYESAQREDAARQLRIAINGDVPPEDADEEEPSAIVTFAPDASPEASDVPERFTPSFSPLSPTSAASVPEFDLPSPVHVLASLNEDAHANPFLASSRIGSRHASNDAAIDGDTLHAIEAEPEESPDVVAARELAAQELLLQVAASDERSWLEFDLALEPNEDDSSLTPIDSPPLSSRTRDPYEIAAAKAAAEASECAVEIDARVEEMLARERGTKASKAAPSRVTFTFSNAIVRGDDDEPSYDDDDDESELAAQAARDAAEAASDAHAAAEAKAKRKAIAASRRTAHALSVSNPQPAFRSPHRSQLAYSHVTGSSFIAPEPIPRQRVRFGGWYLPPHMWHTEIASASNEEDDAASTTSDSLPSVPAAATSTAPHGPRDESTPSSTDLAEKQAELAETLPTLFISSAYKGHLERIARTQQAMGVSEKTALPVSQLPVRLFPSADALARVPVRIPDYLADLIPLDPSKSETAIVDFAPGTNTLANSAVRGGMSPHAASRDAASKRRREAERAARTAATSNDNQPETPKNPSVTAHQAAVDAALAAAEAGRTPASSSSSQSPHRSPTPVHDLDGHRDQSVADVPVRLSASVALEGGTSSSAAVSSEFEDPTEEVAPVQPRRALSDTTDGTYTTVVPDTPDTVAYDPDEKRRWGETIAEGGEEAGDDVGPARGDDSDDA